MTSPFSIGGEVEEEVASTCPYAFLHPDVRKVLCHAPVEEALLKQPCSLLLEYGKCYKLDDLKSEELKIGDWVEQCKFSPNQIFQIESVRFSDWSKKTTCKDSAGHEYYAEDLRKLTPDEIEEHLKPELKIGDYAEVINPGVSNVGEIHKVIRRIDASPYNGYPIQLDDFSWWRVASLRKLTPEEVAMHTGTIGYKMQECNDEMETAMETLRELLAPLVDERLSCIEKQQGRHFMESLDVDKRLVAIEKRLAILEGERPEVVPYHKSDDEIITVTIKKGNGDIRIQYSPCAEELVFWATKVLDSMMEGDQFELD